MSAPTALTRRDLFTGGARGLNDQRLRLPAQAPAADAALHLVRRTSFGPTPDTVSEARAVGVERFLESQLDPRGLSDTGLDAILAERTPSVFLPVEQLFRSRSPQSLREFIDATLLRAVLSKRQLFEVMVDFWSNHFSIYVLKGDTSWLKLIDDREVIRRHALGSFRDLLHASAKSPAMLFYLDNQTNQKAGPNENYARELMELHTLGVDGGYSQRDVQEVARVLTGWSLGSNSSPYPGKFLFLPPKHDTRTKVVLGQEILSNGIHEGEEVLDLLARHPSTARFIAGKLCRRFVSDHPPASIVEEAARTFQETDGDIPSVLRTILLSPEFFASQDLKLQRPFELVVAVLRALGARPSSRGLDLLGQTLSVLGQLPHHHLDPDGYPDEAEAWLSSVGLLTRWNFIQGVATAPGGFFPWSLDSLTSELSTPTVAALVDHVVERLLSRRLAPEDRDAVLETAARGRPPSAVLSASEVESVTRRVAVDLLASPYFQLR